MLYEKNLKGMLIVILYINLYQTVMVQRHSGHTVKMTLSGSILVKSNEL